MPVDYSQNYAGNLQPNVLTNAMAQVQQMNTETKRQDDYTAAGQAWAANGPEAAQTSLQNAGQLDEAMKLKAHVTSMNAEQRKVMDDVANKFGRAAMLADTPADFARFLSSAKQSGLDVSQYEGMDFKAAKLHALAFSDLTSQYITQKNLEDQRAIQQQQFAQQQAHQQAQQNVPYTSPEGVVVYSKEANSFSTPTAIPEGVDMMAPIRGATGGADKSSKEERLIAKIKAENPGMTDTDAIEHYRDLAAKSIAGTSVSIKKDAEGNVVRDAEGRLVKTQAVQAGSLPWIKQETLKLKQKGMDPEFVENIKYTAARAAEQGKFDAKVVDARSSIAAPVIDHLSMMRELLAKPEAGSAVGWIHSHPQYQAVIGQAFSDYISGTFADRQEKLAILEKNLDAIDKDPQAPSIARRLAQLAVGVAMESDRLFTAGQGQVAAKTREEMRPMVYNILTAPTAAEATAAANNMQKMMVKVMFAPTSRDISRSPAIQVGREKSMQMLEGVATDAVSGKRTEHPASIPAGAVYNPARHQYRLPDGTIIDAGSIPVE